MRWDPSHRSRDVIDRRGQRAPRRGGGGGGGGLGLLSLALRTRYGWILVLLYLAYSFFFAGRVDDAAPLGGGAPPAAGATAPGDELARFVGFVLDDVQDTWARLSPLGGAPYTRAKLVLFTGATSTACGYGDAAVGPFYCPADQRVYIDLDFYQALRDRLGAPGDFAQAYVIAHEIGHHVQHLLGTTARVRGGRDRGADGPAVRLELQADCYAGVWAHSAAARGLLEVGDVDEALAAAAAIGDDTLQRQASGRVRPETFSHGTSAQRARWFRVGLDRGDPAACDTFAAREL